MENNQDTNYSLICAVRAGCLETARKLIDSFGLSYSQAWSEGYVLLCDALKNNHAAVAKLLLTSGCEVNSKSKKPSNTPLHFAVINGDIEIVKMLLDKKAKINVKNQYGRTPLHEANQCKKIEITELLLKRDANINATDNNGISPLHVAVENGSKEVVTLLISRGVNVDIKGEDNMTPLHIAAKKGYIHIVEDLLNLGACTHSLTLKEGYTPLHFATKSGHTAVVNLLLQHTAKIDNQGTDGKTILRLAVQRGNLIIVENILKYCPDINNQGNRSSIKTAVYRCCSKKPSNTKYEKIVEALLAYGFIVNPEDANNPKLLHDAVQKGFVKIVEDLLKYGADVNTVRKARRYKGFTPLHTAVKNEQEEVAKLLISYGADINAEDETGRTPIFYAIGNADLKITKLLLTNRANVKNNHELLKIAVTKEYIAIVEALLQYADVNASDEYGRTALHFTALSDVSRNFHINKDPNISIKGEIAKLLVSKGANVDAQTISCVTLHCIARNGFSIAVVDADMQLLKYKTDIKFRVKCDFTRLNLSAQTGNKELSTILLNNGANVNAKQNDGLTALHLATLNGYEDVVNVLLECGAKVDSKIKFGYTPLHWGAQEGYHKIIENILKFGADINSTDEYGRTALHIASREGHVDVVETLLEYGADINIMNRSDHTPLDSAMNGIRSFYTQRELRRLCPYGDYYQYDLGDGVCLCEVTAKALKCHIVKLIAAGLYVSQKNVSAVSSKNEQSDFQDECEKEIATMKREKINNASISFYNILVKDTNSLAMYMKNENIVQALKSEVYKTKFPIYASMIENHFRKGMERRDLLDQGNKIFSFLFNNFFELPHHCIEKIVSYLNDGDLRILTHVYVPSGNAAQGHT